MDSNNDRTAGRPETRKPIGFRSPPEATRFRKGRSGNPAGRPKGSLNVGTLLMKALREKVVVNEHGRRKTVTKLEAALTQLVNMAATGNIRALRQLTDLARDAEIKQVPSQNTEFKELDREVIEGILRRFQTGEE